MRQPRRAILVARSNSCRWRCWRCGQRRRYARGGCGSCDRRSDGARGSGREWQRGRRDVQPEDGNDPSSHRRSIRSLSIDRRIWQRIDGGGISVPITFAVHGRGSHHYGVHDSASCNVRKDALEVRARCSGRRDARGAYTVHGHFILQRVVQGCTPRRVRSGTR